MWRVALYGTTSAGPSGPAGPAGPAGPPCKFRKIKWPCLSVLRHWSIWISWKCSYGPGSGSACNMWTEPFWGSPMSPVWVQIIPDMICNCRLNLFGALLKATFGFSLFWIWFPIVSWTSSGLSHGPRLDSDYSGPDFQLSAEPFGDSLMSPVWVQITLNPIVNCRLNFLGALPWAPYGFRLVWIWFSSVGWTFGELCHEPRLGSEPILGTKKLGANTRGAHFGYKSARRPLWVQKRDLHREIAYTGKPPPQGDRLHRENSTGRTPQGDLHRETAHTGFHSFVFPSRTCSRDRLST